MAARKEHRALKAHYIFSFFWNKVLLSFNVVIITFVTKERDFFAYKEAAVYFLIWQTNFTVAAIALVVGMLI